MNPPPSLEERQRLVAEAAHNFVQADRPRDHILAPYADSIQALREKHASYRVITSILQSAGVRMSHHTVARFCRDSLDGKQRKKKSHRKHIKRKPVTQPRQPEASASQSMRPALRSPPKSASDLIAERRRMDAIETHPRERGPRIADPRNV